MAASDALRVLPGAILSDSGQRGGISSLFVRGGESTYNKLIVDGVAVDTPGQTTDFGTIPLTEVDRLEFVRGAQSTLYGTDAMTSVIQVWTRTGSTTIPELRLAADGGNFGTATGSASLSGAWQHFDYNAFANQFATNGQGINNHYSNALQGANVGLALTDQVALRVRVRHTNSYTGLPGEFSFNGNDPIVTPDGINFYPLPPDPAEYSHQNNLLGSVELTIHQPSGWQHRLTAFDYLYRYHDVNLNGDPARVDGFGFPFDYPTLEYDHINRIGFEYQGDYSERTWAHTTFGYRVENENGMISNLAYDSFTPGQRLEHDFYAQQQLTLGRLNVIAGARFIHNSDFGNTGVPRVALTLLALRGGDFFSGTRLRFTYATGFMEPALYQIADGPPYYVPNPGLLPERTRAFEAGIQQNFLAGRWVFNATYFNNLFHDQIEFADNEEGIGQFFNVQQSLAHGAELQLQGKISSRILFNASYTNLSDRNTSKLRSAPRQTSAIRSSTPATRCSAAPNIPPPRSLTYWGNRWGGNLGGKFCRPPSRLRLRRLRHNPRRRLRARERRSLARNQHTRNRLRQRRQHSQPALQRGSRLPRNNRKHPSRSALHNWWREILKRVGILTRVPHPSRVSCERVGILTEVKPGVKQKISPHRALNFDQGGKKHENPAQRGKRMTQGPTEGRPKIAP